MIVMPMGDEDMCGGRHVFDIKGQRFTVLYKGQAKKYRINQDVLINIFYHDTCVFKERNRQPGVGFHGLPINCSRHHLLILVMEFIRVFV